MKRIVLMWCVALLLGLAGQVAALDDGGKSAGTGVLKVTIQGFNNDKGGAKVAIFNSGESFKKGDRGIDAATLPIKGGKAEWTLAGLPFGTYAIKVYHDENGNGKLDKNAMGMPKEQYGFSNDATGSFGPPDYEKAKFTFGKSDMAIAITVE